MGFMPMGCNACIIGFCARFCQIKFACISVPIFDLVHDVETLHHANMSV